MAKKIYKTVIISGRVTDKQESKLSNYLKRRGMTRSEWLREKIEGIRG